MLAGCSGTSTSNPDASSPDSAVTDAASTDTASSDTASTDVTSTDVTSADATPDTTTADVARPDTGTPDATAPDATGCTGAAPGCVSGTAGGTCGDAVTPATCSNNAWRCADGQVFLSQCACAGRPPGAGCTCTPRGWSCDAGAPDAPSDATVDAGCTGAAPLCASGTAGGQCGDTVTSATCVGNAWRCGDGQVLASQCACVGRPPGAGCVCLASGWSCDAGVAPDASALVDCNPAHAACDVRPPVCAGGGQVPSINGACWGPCVVYTQCAPIDCNPDAASSGCPTNLVCYRTTRRCGPPL